MEVAKPSASEEVAGSSVLGRNQFLIYRLFSLAGLIPVGAYLVVHLATNAAVLGGANAFQAQVDRIHSLGPVLVTILEWTFIFIPILFHAAVGFWIIAGGLPNVGSYPYGSNVRYTLQRATGMIAIAFILFHVWQLHHLGKGEFDVHHAASSAATALDPLFIKIVYIVGTLSVVYHFANGLWTFGITWGIWTSEGAQRRAGYVCTAIGIFVAVLGMTALYGMSTVDVEKAKVIEDRMRTHREQSEGIIDLDVDLGLPDVSPKPTGSSPKGD